MLAVEPQFSNTKNYILSIITISKTKCLPDAKGALQVLLDFYPQCPIAEAPSSAGFVVTAPK
jgi:hypothetical protein